MSDTLATILAHLDRGDCPATKWPDTKGEYWALCPFHVDEHSGSFSVGPRGFRCFACDAKGSLTQLAKHLGIETRPETHGTRKSEDVPFGEHPLQEYAQAKALDVELLRSLGLTEGRYKGEARLELPYYDESGNETARRYRVKLSGKGAFRWRRGATIVPYGLWCLEDAREAGYVLLVEGESDCHTCWQHDIPCLGAPGANNWRPEWASYLDGLTVFVWREPDQGGAKFAQAIDTTLPNARIVTAPPGRKDPSEMHLLGDDLPARLRELMAEAQPCRGPEAEAPHSTDLGNARRLVAQHGADLRYCDGLGGWLVWDRRRWAQDDTGEAMRRAKATAAAIWAEVAEQPDEDSRKAMAAWAKASEGAARLRAMVELASTEPGVVARAEAFDADPWLLNCANGTLDLRTGALRPHRREDMLTKLAPVNYDPSATDAVLEQYLDTVTQGDADLAAYLQRACGYTLSGSTAEEVLFLALGPAATGKSTLVEAMLAALGGYAVKASFATFLETPHVGGATPELARLRGARMVAAVETARTRRLNEPLIKEATGGDLLTARELYRSPITFKPEFKLWLAANEAPLMDDEDTGLWRRVQRVPFERELAEEERDPGVKAHLTSDGLPALLAWAVKGCLAWQRVGLRPCEVVRRKTTELRAGFDPLAEFFAHCCAFIQQAETPAGDLRGTYEAWAEDLGAKPISNTEWGRRLEAKGCQRVRTRVAGRQMTVWRGIGLVDEAATDEGVQDVQDGGPFSESHTAKSETAYKKEFARNAVRHTRPAQTEGRGAPSGDLDAKALETLAALGAAGYADIASRLGARLDATEAVLGRLAAAGRVQLRDDGLYTAAAKAQR